MHVAVMHGMEKKFVVQASESTDFEEIQEILENPIIRLIAHQLDPVKPIEIQPLKPIEIKDCGKYAVYINRSENQVSIFKCDFPNTCRERPSLKFTLEDFARIGKKGCTKLNAGLLAIKPLAKDPGQGK